MRNTFKRVLSFILALTMVLGLGVNAFAIASDTVSVEFFVGKNGRFGKTSDCALPYEVNVEDNPGVKVLDAIKNPTYTGDGDYTPEGIAAYINGTYDNYLNGYNWDGKYYKDSSCTTTYSATDVISDDTNIYLNYVNYCMVYFYVGTELYKTPVKLTKTGNNFKLEKADLPATTGIKVDGFNCTGWLGEDNALINESGVIISGTRTSYVVRAAGQAIKKYVVTFDANGGALKNAAEAQREVVEGQPVGTLPEVNDREGYKFLGWKAEGDANYWTKDVVIDNNYTLFAQWDAIQYWTITFDPNGGEFANPEDATKKVEKGTAIGEMPTPTRAGYAFAGWYEGNFEILPTRVIKNSDHIYTAKWVAGGYTVTFDNQEEITGKPATSLAVKNGEAIGNTFSDHELVPTGYKFDGWYSDAARTTKAVLPEGTWNLTENVTFYAKYTAKTYKAKLFAKVGATITPLGELTATYNEEFDLADFEVEAVKENRPFVNWIDGNDKVINAPFVWTTDGDVNFYAKYSDKQQFTVTFNDDLGGFMYSELYDAGTNVNFPEIEKKAGYAGAWTVKATGTEISGSYTITQDEVFQLKYTANKYQIIFKSNGKDVAGKPVYYGQKLALLLPSLGDIKNTSSAYVDGYEFLGWEFAGKVYEVGCADVWEYEDNAVFYAKWAPAEYTVTLDANGGRFADGTATKQFQIKTGESFSGKLETPAKDNGNAFVIWRLDLENVENLENKVFDFAKNITLKAIYEDDVDNTTIDVKVVDTWTGDVIYDSYRDNSCWDSNPTYHYTGLYDDYYDYENGISFSYWFNDERNRYMNGFSIYEDIELGEYLARAVVVAEKYGYTVGIATAPDGESYSYNTVTINNELLKPITKDTIFYIVYDGKVAYQAQIPNDNKVYPIATYNVRYGQELGKAVPAIEIGDDLSYFGGKQILPTKDAGLTFNGWFEKPYDGNLIGVAVNTPEMQAEVVAGATRYQGSGPYDKIVAEYVAYTNVKDIDAKLDAKGGVFENGLGEIVVKIPYGENVGKYIGSVIPTKVGYNFVGWETFGISNMPNKATTFEAVWEAKLFNVTFLKADGSVKVAPMTVQYGGVIGALPQTTAPAGQEFVGWVYVDGNGDETPIVVNGTWDIDAGDIVITPKFEYIDYTITFDAKDGKFADGTSKKVFDKAHYGDNVLGLLEEVPVKEGYNFGGWCLASGSAVPANATVTMTDTVYAYWIEKVVKVNFYDPMAVKPNVAVGTGSVTYGKTLMEATLTVPPVVAHDGYTFDVWVDEAGNEVENDTPIKEDDELINLKATYVENEYNLYFDANGGEFTSPLYAQKKVTYTKPVGELPTAADVTKAGYDFGGWFDSNNIEWTAASIWDFAADGNVTAKWTPHEYNVTLDPNGGVFKEGVSDTMQVAYNSAFGALPTENDLYRKGFVLTEWHLNKFDKTVKYNTTNIWTEDITLTATWTANKVEGLSDANKQYFFDLDGGEMTFTKFCDVTYGQKLDLPVPTKVGFNFIGWEFVGTEKEAYPERNVVKAVMVNGVKLYQNGDVWDKDVENFKLKAHWVAKTFTLKFVSDYCDSTQLPEDMTVIYGKEVKLPLTFAGIEVAGRDFQGWYINGGIYNDRQIDAWTIDAEQGAMFEARAIYNPHNYTLKFDLDGGKYGEMTAFEDSTIAAYENIILVDLTKTGYVFDGWFVNGDKTLKVENGDAWKVFDKGDVVTLKAIWTPETYELTFKLAADEVAGSFVESTVVTVTYLANVSGMPTETPLKTGYAFAGWYSTELGCIVANGTQWTLTEGDELHATWSANTYTITFDDMGGKIEGDATKAVKYGDTVGTIPSATKTGYTFDGWWYQGIDGTEHRLEANSIFSAAAPHLFPADNFTAKAHWNAGSYTVTYKANGGVFKNISGNPTEWVQSVAYAKEFALADGKTELYKPGYEFGYWSLSNVAGAAEYNYTGTYNKVGHTILFAQWNVKEFKVTLNANHPENDVTAETALGINPGYVTVKYNQALSATEVALPNITGKVVGGYEATGKWLDATNGKVVDLTVPYTYDNDVTLYAEWKPATFTVSYSNSLTDCEPYTTPDDIEVKYLDNIKASVQLPELSKVGYTFNGWKYPNGKLVKEEGTVWYIKENTVLTADWTPKTYTLTIKSNNAANDIKVDSTMTYGKIIEFPAEPAKTGYTFDGWYLGETKFASTVNVPYNYDNNVTIEAKYTANKYTVTFDAQGGTLVPETKTTAQVTYDDVVGDVLPDAKKTGYTFVGWNFEAGKDTANVTSATTWDKAENTTVYAVYTLDEYKATFDYQGGADTENNSSLVIAYNYGDNILAKFPTAVTKTGYEFKGWKIGNTDVTASSTYDFEKNIDVVATWTAKTYKINVNPDNDGATLPYTVEVKYNEIPVIATPTRVGYDFDSWVEANTEDWIEFDASARYLRTTDYAIEGAWTAKTYHVTIDTNNGVPSTAKEIQYKKVALTLDTPTRTGYTFDYWKVTAPADHVGDIFKSGDCWMIPDNGTVQAQWTAKDCTIKLQLAGGESLAPSEKTVFTVKYDSKVGVLPDAIKAGYEFKGWIEKNTKAPVTAETVWKTVEETTLVPTWTAKSTEVTFDANGGKYADNTTTKAIWQTYDAVINCPAQPTKVGYNFKGWYTDSVEEIKAYTAQTTKWDNEATTATLWAHWTAVEYELTFNYNDDTAYTESWTYTYGEQIEFPTSAGTKIGYEFKGWAMKDTTTLLDVNNSWYNFTGDVTIEALWDAIDYKVSYYNENALYAEQTEHYGKLITLPAQPTKVGYDFAGWFFKDVAEGQDWVQFKADTIYSYANDVNVYAEWTPKKFTVTLDSNAPQNEVFFDGTKFQKKVITVTYDATSAAEGENSVPNNLYRKGYHFTGWYLTKDGTGEMLKAQEPWKITQDTTYYAGWEKETYKVEFVLNLDDLDEAAPHHYDYLYLNRTYQNGEVETALGAEKFIGKTVTYDEVASQIPSFNDMALKGYTLRAWVAVWNENGDQKTRTLPNDQNAKVWDIDVGEPNDVVTMYAIWEANKYTVKYDVVGNLPSKYTNLDVTPDGFTDYEYVYFDTINDDLNDPKPTKVGYIFDGWYVGETKIENDTRWTWVAGDFTEYSNVPTLKAHWTPEKYIIKFVDDDSQETQNYVEGFNEGHQEADVFGLNLAQIEVTYDAALPHIYDNDDVKEDVVGYDLVGWNYLDNVFAKHAFVDAEHDPWNIDVNGATEAHNAVITFYAVWDAHENVITFNKDYTEGNGLLKASRADEIDPDTLAPFTSEFDKTILATDLPTLTLSGYTFLGWYTDPIVGQGTKVGKDQFWKFDAATTLYAQWKAETYTDGISGFDVLGALAGDDGIDGTADDMFHKTETLDPEKSVYDALTAIDVTYDTPIANADLPDDPEIEGYTFLGWDVVDSEGNVLGNVGTKAAPVALEVALDEVTNTPVKLAAKWEAKNYGPIKLKPGEGATVDPDEIESVTYGQDIEELPTPVKPGYTFDGWYYYNEGEKTPCIPVLNEIWTEPTTDLHAHWIANNYTVTFNPGTYGSVSPKSKAVVYDQPYGWLPTPSYGSYKFLGWVNQNNVLVDSSTIYKIDGNSTLYASYKGTSTIILDYRNMAGFEVDMGGGEEIFLGEFLGEQLVEEVVETPVEEVAEEVTEEVEAPAEEVAEEVTEEVVEETTEVVIENRNGYNEAIIDGGNEEEVKVALEEALENDEIVVISDGKETKAVKVIGYNADKDNFEVEEVTEINPDTGASVPANIAPAMFALLAAAAFAFGKRK